MRNFQVSDVKNEFCFRDYWTSRVLSCSLMMLIGVIYGFVRYGSQDSLLTVVLFVGYRVTDSIEDVIHGLAQKEGRLDAASCVKAVRIFLATVAFCVVFAVTKSLVASSTALFAVSLAFLLLSVGPFNKEFPQLDYRLQFSGVWKLLWLCLPLCGSSLIQTYIINSPKYAIDRLLSSELQAIFNILFMPIFSLNLLVMFIFNPLVADLSKIWTDGNMKEFRRIVRRQIVIVSGMTGLAAVCSYFFGCEILGMIYGVELRAYKTFLMILMIFGGIAAMVTFLCIIATIIRKQREIILSYLLAAVFSFVFSDLMVRNYGMEGAGYLYGLLMTVIFVFLVFTVLRTIRRQDAGSGADETGQSEKTRIDLR